MLTVSCMKHVKREDKMCKVTFRSQRYCDNETDQDDSVGVCVGIGHVYLAGGKKRGKFIEQERKRTSDK